METEEAIESINPQPNLIEFKSYARKDNPDIRAHIFEPLYKPKISKESSSQWRKPTEFIENVNVSIRDLTRTLIERISKLDDVVFRGKTSYSAYIGKRRIIFGFAGIRPGKLTIKIYVRTNTPTFSDPKRWIDPKKVRWFTEYEEQAFTITSIDQIDYAMELIRQSYQIVKLAS